MYKQKVKCLFLDNSLDNSQSADVNRGYLSLLLSNSGTLGRAGVHIPWTCDHGPRRVDGLASLGECGLLIYEPGAQNYIEAPS
jgi:hypothetical protein